MRRVHKEFQDVVINSGDLLVVYRGTSKVFAFSDNSVIIKGNIKRDKTVEKVWALVKDEY